MPVINGIVLSTRPIRACPGNSVAAYRRCDRPGAFFTLADRFPGIQASGLALVERECCILAQDDPFRADEFSFCHINFYKDNNTVITKIQQERRMITPAFITKSASSGDHACTSSPFSFRSFIACSDRRPSSCGSTSSTCVAIHHIFPHSSLTAPERSP